MIYKSKVPKMAWTPLVYDWAQATFLIQMLIKLH